MGRLNLQKIQECQIQQMLSKLVTLDSHLSTDFYFLLIILLQVSQKL